MWHIAVYTEHQHAQYRATNCSFTLCKRAAETTWQLHDDAPDEIDGAEVIQMRVESNSLWIDCRAARGALELVDGATFSTDVPIEAPLPVLFQIGEAWIEVRAETDLADLDLQPLGTSRKASASAPAPAARGPDGETVTKWLAAAGQLHRMAASAPTFFDAAAQIALDCTGLDAAFILTRVGSEWTIAGSALEQPRHGISYEYVAVQLAAQYPDVWRRLPRVAEANSLPTDITTSDSIIVAPVRGVTGEVEAVVYGVRHGRGDNRRRGIRTLEARVIESIAEALSIGMARRQQEVSAARQRVLFEQAFSPTVVDYLHRHPEALVGQMREVTLLFADLRDFTSLAERLPPEDSCNLVGDVMEMLTRAILNHRGTVVDYYGDGVCAMWNAPLEVAAHADQACTAAMEMLNDLPEISDQWRHLIPTALQLGIGVHSGVVQVGNAGTRRWMKYGPRGSAVNLTSRVQSAAKRLDVALLATDAVRRKLSDRFVTLKVCSAQLPGLAEPVELFTVFPSTDGLRLQGDLDRYAEALDAFERGDLDAAESQLAQLLDAKPATPARFLAQQTAALRQGATGRRASDDFAIMPDAVVKILSK